MFLQNDGVSLSQSSAQRVLVPSEEVPTIVGCSSRLVNDRKQFKSKSVKVVERRQKFPRSNGEVMVLEVTPATGWALKQI